MLSKMGVFLYVICNVECTELLLVGYLCYGMDKIYFAYGIMIFMYD
jgi:hypothetical protein